MVTCPGKKYHTTRAPDVPKVTNTSKHTLRHNTANSEVVITANVRCSLPIPREVKRTKQTAATCPYTAGLHFRWETERGG